jgi:hypothetical protein
MLQDNFKDLGGTLTILRLMHSVLSFLIAVMSFNAHQEGRARLTNKLSAQLLLTNASQ